MGRKWIDCILIPLLVAGIFSLNPLTAMAAEDPATGLTYEVEGGEATVTGFAAPPGFNGELVIPDTLGGASVTSIGSWAFFICESITSVSIPDSVTSISDRAFNICSKLVNVSLGTGLISIGDSAFRDCEKLTNISLPESVQNIGSNVFRDCDSLVSISIPEGVTSISSYLFYNCSSLEDVTIPESVTSIEADAFDNCSGMEEIIIPEGVTSIGNYAFKGCSSLTEITIPDAVTSIGSSVFCFCERLTKVILPNGITSLNDDMFYNCIRLEEITIPESVTSIASWAFGNCSSLSDIALPEGVASIGDSTFKGCSSLASITIPASAESIGVDAFNGCPDNLIIYGYTGSYAQTYADNNEIDFVALEYPLTIIAGTGGSITSGNSGDYEEGEVIAITAEPAFGYTFSHWTSSNGGSFADEESAETTFTMPGNAVTITANFSVVLPPVWPEGSNLNVSDKGRKALSLDWTAAIDGQGINGYKIYQDGVEIATVAGDVTAYRVGGLSAARRYAFQVKAGNAHGVWTTDGPTISVTTRRSSSSSVAPNFSVTPVAPPVIPGEMNEDLLNEVFNQWQLIARRLWLWFLI